jgi:hypothetical protein
MRFLSGSTSVDTALVDTSLLGVSVTSSGLHANIDWGQVATVTTQFDTDAVRQGRTVDPANSVSLPMAGSLTANWSVADLTVQSPGFAFPFDIGSIAMGSTGNCSARFSGGTYVCHLESAPQSIVDTAPFPGPYVDAKVVADITVTPAALTTLRTASIGGVPVGNADLALTETPTTDPLQVACTAGVGDHLTYALGALSSTSGLHVQASLQVEVGSSVVNPAYPATDPNPVLRVPVASPSFSFAAADTSITLGSTGATFDLGAVQADDQAVMAVAGGPYAGSEGSPIAFDGSASTVGCGATLHWTFSDGGSADGAHVTHTFTDDGMYTGTLTATKGAQTDTATFAVTVDNEAPSVDAGADTSASVGAAVSFAGSATDPSSVDQGSLTYTWQFADGTSNATGADVTHTFTQSGVYDVTLTVCDKDGGCGTGTRRVTVANTAQPTVLVNLSDLIGRKGSTAAFRAVLVDRELRPLPGRTIVFKLGTQTMTATTDARGIAITKATVAQKAGLYAVTATFTPGGTDAQQYKGSSMRLPFLVLR